MNAIVEVTGTGVVAGIEPSGSLKSILFTATNAASTFVIADGAGVVLATIKAPSETSVAHTFGGGAAFSGGLNVTTITANSKAYLEVG